jgi:hypothetical protein
MWHTHCFKCTHCGIPLEERNFYEKNGKPYCEKDYMDLFHPKCTGCKLPITEVRILSNYSIFLESKLALKQFLSALHFLSDFKICNFKRISQKAVKKIQT